MPVSLDSGGRPVYGGVPRISFWGCTFNLILSYDISNKMSLYMQVYHTRVTNCTVARLQVHKRVDIC